MFNSLDISSRLNEVGRLRKTLGSMEAGNRFDERLKYRNRVMPENPGRAAIEEMALALRLRCRNAMNASRKSESIEEISLFERSNVRRLPNFDSA